MKQIRFLIILLLIIFAYQVDSHAEAWKYQLTDMLQDKEENGEKVYTFNVEIFNYFIKKIEFHAGRYPPTYKDDKEKVFITQQLKTLIGMVKIIDDNKNQDSDFLSLYGWALAMGHNLDFPKSADEADQVFKRSLAIDPNHALTNYYYGEHLYNSGRIQESIPYLKKSVANGFNEAKFSLAMISLMDKKDWPQAEKLLEEYIKESKLPKDHPLHGMLKSLKDKKLKVTYTKSTIEVIN